ncbi:MAG: glycosyltransferase family 39 protein [Chloroflexota bacterium]
MITRHSTYPRWIGPAMLAVLLLAAYLRIHDLNAQGMWGDEGWSIWLARGDTPRDLTLTMVADHHGPVYSLLLRGWELLAGETVLALRWITALFSIASIALIYALGRALFNPSAGVGAALAFALMDKHVVLTQEVRDYPMIFLTMIAIALYYVRWRRSPRGGNAFWFVAWSVLGLYLHYYCYMVNLAILVHAGLSLRERMARRHFLALNGLIALAFAPWLPIVVHQFVGTPVNSEVLNIHGMPLNRQTIEYLATESFGQPVALYALLMVVGAWGPLSDRLPGSLGRIPRDRRLSGALLALLWFAVPVLITWALHTRYPLITDRNISVIMPAIALLVGAGLTAFERFGAVFIAALVIVNGLLTVSSYFDKPPWREMAADIGAAYPGGEPVLLDVEGAHAALWYHLALELPVDVDHVVNLLPPEAEGEDLAVSLYDLRKRYRGDFIPRLQRILAETDGLWLAYWGDEAKKHDVLDALAAGGFVRTGTLEYEHHGNPIYAYRYDRADSFGAPLAEYGPIALRRAVLPDAARPGGTIHALLWWSAADAPPADYTVSVFLLDAAGVLRAQHDGFPAGGSRPTSAWSPGELVFDAHAIRLPGDLPPGDYTVGVKLYTWWDGSILPTGDGAEYAVVGTVAVR